MILFNFPYMDVALYNVEPFLGTATAEAHTTYFESIRKFEVRASHNMSLILVALAITEAAGIFRSTKTLSKSQTCLSTATLANKVLRQ